MLVFGSVFLFVIFDFVGGYAEPFEHVLFVGVLLARIGEIKAKFVDDFGALMDPFAPSVLAEVFKDELSDDATHWRVGQFGLRLTCAAVDDGVAGDFGFGLLCLKV